MKHMHSGNAMNWWLKSKLCSLTCCAPKSTPFLNVFIWSLFSSSVIHIWKRNYDIQIKGHYNIWWELYVAPCAQSSPPSKLQLPTSVDPESANEKTLPHCLGFPGDPAVKNLHTMQGSQETFLRSLGRVDPLEEGLATRSRILAWRISWTEEPDGLQSIGSQRVRHGRNNRARVHISPCGAVRHAGAGIAFSLQNNTMSYCLIPQG